jgi:aminopeptidase YwaD
MRTLVLFISLLVIYSQVGFSQDKAYAKEIIQTLCSEPMKGRGYVEGGDKKAAEFLAGEFEKMGLKKISKSYFQSFTTPVNSFPGKMSLIINGKTLTPGKDFLIDAGSPGIKGKFAVENITADDLLNEDILAKKLKHVPSKFLVIHPFTPTSYSAEQAKQIQETIAFLQYSKQNPAKGTVVLTNAKLTWSGSTEVLPAPTFTISATAIQGPITTIEIDVENKFLRSHETQNVVGYIEGENKDSLLVFTEHYDHLGMMGKQTMFPGANDNASGVALMLDLAKRYSKSTPKHSMVFIAFAGEEIGLIGSKYFTEHPLFPLGKIKFLLNFDIAGTGDDGIQIVNGKIYQRYFDVIKKLNDEHQWLKQIKIRGEACNSDHCMFYTKGVPCFFIYTLGGIQAYHDIDDRAETLPLTEYEDYFKLLVDFIKTL